MTTHYQDLTQRVKTSLADLHQAVPDVMKRFGMLGKAAMAAGALDAKTKELIALAVGVAARCDGCIGFHTQALVRLGASREEVFEALGVAAYMGGGPAVMYASNAAAAFNEFSTAAGGAQER